MAGYTFEPGPIIAYMEKQASKAVMNATRIAVKHAQRHAPVRKLFKGTTFTTDKMGFRTPKIRRVTAEGQEREGHANSFIPLIRNRPGGPNGPTVFISGDFRRVGSGEQEYRFNLGRGSETYERGSQRLAKISTGYKPGTIGETSGAPDMFGRSKGTLYKVPGSQTIGQLTAFKQVKGGKVQLVDSSTLPPLSGHDLRSGKANRPVLTSKGRAEVRSGRANFTSPEDGITRVGGRLRGEIHAEGPTKIGGVIWGQVVSATKDPETGRLYPRDQEFGNAHNRPHPYMRPGLHDSRGALRREIRDAVRLGKQ